LEPVHPQLVLHPADRRRHGRHIGDGTHLLVVVQPALQLAVKRVGGILADADHGRPGPGQRAGEVPLVVREERLDEDHVHASHASASPGERPPGTPRWPRPRSFVTRPWPCWLARALDWYWCGGVLPQA